MNAPITSICHPQQPFGSTVRMCVSATARFIEFVIAQTAPVPVYLLGATG